MRRATLMGVAPRELLSCDHSVSCEVTSEKHLQLQRLTLTCMCSESDSCSTLRKSRPVRLALMATPAAVPTVQDIPDKPHQPSASYKFPKRTFGQKKPVSRSFQPAWFSQWPFLHYNEANDVAYCHTCLLAFKISNHNVDPAFVSVLFNQKSFFHTNIITGDQRIQQLEGWNHCFPKP